MTRVRRGELPYIMFIAFTVMIILGVIFALFYWGLYLIGVDEKVFYSDRVETFINSENRPLYARGKIIIAENVSSVIDLPDNAKVITTTGNLSLVDPKENIWRGKGVIVYTVEEMTVYPGERIDFTGVLTVAPSRIQTSEYNRFAFAAASMTTTIVLFLLVFVHIFGRR